MTLAEVCDLSYAMQVWALEREVEAVWANAPHLPQGSELPSMEGVRADFDAWLVSEPAKRKELAPGLELAGLSEVLGVAKAGRPA